MRIKIVNYDLYVSSYVEEYLALALEKYSSLESETFKNVSEMEIDANSNKQMDGYYLI